MINLMDFQSRQFSQRGEDGILEKIFQSLGIRTGFAIELGAWDGVHFSNTYALITKGWSGVYIEADAVKYEQLLRNMKNYSGVICVNSFVSLEKGCTLSDILITNSVQEDFDLLSIDLDGIDYWILCELTYRPKVIICEYNSNWKGRRTVKYDHNFVWDGTQYFGASGDALAYLLKDRGYECVAHIANNNLVFIRKELQVDKFIKFDLTLNLHISTNHHPPMSKAQEMMLVDNPPIYLSKSFRRFIGDA